VPAVLLRWSANAWPRNVKATGFGLNDNSVLSSSCDARSLSRNNESGGMGANARRSHSDEQVALMMMQMTFGIVQAMPLDPYAAPV
jgi:hypothetical protein